MLNRRPVIALVVALVLWFPSLQAFLGQRIDLVPAATRFLAAFAVAWIGVTVLGMIVAGYGRSVPAEPDHPLRRRTDPAEELDPAE